MITLITNSHPLEEIGAKSLKGYLEAHGIPVRLIYLGIPLLPRRLEDDIVQLVRGSLLVGCSAMSMDVRLMSRLSGRIRRELGIPVILGGIHATALPAETLKFCDFVCVGEGEEPLRQLCERLRSGEARYDDIPNLGYHTAGGIQLNRVTYSVPSLDETPFPDYVFRDCYTIHNAKHSGVSLARIPEETEERTRFFSAAGHTALLFYSQRGCPMSCTYCSNSLYHQIARHTGVPWYRCASPARIKQELRSHLALLPFVRTLWYNDDDLLARPFEELEDIAGLIHGELKRPFNINAIPAKVTEEKIAMLARHGLGWVHMGVQSGSERTLRETYHRRVRPEEVLNAARIIHRHAPEGVKQMLGFILDNPYEDADDWRASLRLLLALPHPRKIILYSLAFFPGTALTQRAIEDGHLTMGALEFDKSYILDLQASYQNFLFLLNHKFRVPGWANNLAMSDFVCRSRVAAPFRALLAFVAGAAVRAVSLYYWMLGAVPLLTAYRGIRNGGQAVPRS